MAFIVMLTVGAILFGSNQIMPQLLQTNFPYTAMLSGLAMMPGGIAMLVMMPIAGQFTGRVQPKYLIALGLTVIALAMWYSTTLAPDASFGYFALLRVFQMIGTAVPVHPDQHVAYDGLPQDKTNQGSALINVARNLGGSIGVSLANTELDRNASSSIRPGWSTNLSQSSPTFQSSDAQFDAILYAIWLACRAHSGARSAISASWSAIRRR